MFGVFLPRATPFATHRPSLVGEAKKKCEEGNYFEKKREDFEQVHCTNNKVISAHPVHLLCALALQPFRSV